MYSKRKSHDICMAYSYIIWHFFMLLIYYISVYKLQISYNTEIHDMFLICIPLGNVSIGVRFDVTETRKPMIIENGYIYRIFILRRICEI